MAIKTFANRTTADIAHGENTKDARRIAQRVWTAARRRLDALHAATSLNDLNLPGLRLENLKFTKPGFFSIRVNDQYRIVFRFESGEAHDVEIADYHGR